MGASTISGSGFALPTLMALGFPGLSLTEQVETLSRKDLVEELLHGHGFSVPHGAAFARDALDEAEVFFKTLLSSPDGACVKPADGRLGELVHLRVRDINAFRVAFAAIAERHERILVEEMVPGTVFRFLCLAGRVVAVRYGQPVSVEGDGIHTIADLVRLKNAERQLNPGHNYAYQLGLGPSERRALEQAGLNSRDVPERGTKVLLGALSNIHQGAESIDVSDAVHASYVTLVENAIGHFPGMILCGADVAIPDVSQPETSDNYHILELNSGPDFSSHHYPWRGQPRDIAGAIIDYLQRPLSSPAAEGQSEQRVATTDNKAR